MALAIPDGLRALGVSLRAALVMQGITRIYIAMTKPIRTKTFKSGDSVAVPLPKEFAIPEGTDVELDKSGDIVTLRVTRDAAREKARMLKLLNELDALPKPPSVEKREPIEFPERDGL